MINGPIHQEDTIILNVYKPNYKASKKQKLIELVEEVDKSTIIVRESNIPLSTTDEASRKKISEDLESGNKTINQLHLTFTELAINTSRICMLSQCSPNT